MAETVAASQAPAPKQGEVQIDVARLNGSETEAGEALTGLFAEEFGDAEQAQNPPEGADTEQAETPAIGEQEDGQSEQPEAAAIEPPLSWTAEAKQRFAQLPPELQQYVVERESERERLISTQGQKASEEAKRLETERLALANERAQQANFLQGYLLQLYPELQRFAQTDWNKLAAEEPAKWASERQAYDSLQMRMGMAQQQLKAVNDQQQAEQQKAAQAFLTEQHQKLVAQMPELSDRVKLKAFGDDLVKHLPEFSPAEIGNVADHRLLLIARDAMKWRQHQQALAEARTKRAPAVTPAQQQRQLRPTPRRADAAEVAQGKQLAALHDNLRKSGSTRDAADLLAATGIFGKA